MSDRKRVRVVQVVVKPILVVDDGQTLAPVDVEQIAVTAENWPTYPVTGFAEAVTRLEAELNAQGQPESNGKVPDEALT